MSYQSGPSRDLLLEDLQSAHERGEFDEPRESSELGRTPCPELYRQCLMMSDRGRRQHLVMLSTPDAERRRLGKSLRGMVEAQVGLWTAAIEKGHSGQVGDGWLCRPPRENKRRESKGGWLSR
jgi:hypothetical protein